jgi:hypothetical protein
MAEDIQPEKRAVRSPPPRRFSARSAISLFDDFIRTLNAEFDERTAAESAELQ